MKTRWSEIIKGIEDEIEYHICKNCALSVCCAMADCEDEDEFCSDFEWNSNKLFKLAQEKYMNEEK